MPNDITELKKIEKKILYQAKLVENVSDAIISTDLDFNIISWNKAAEKVYGWKAEEVIGKNIRDIITIEYLSDDEESVISLLIEEGYWKGEVIQSHKNGNKINILSSVSIIKDDSENPIGAMAINRDITKKKQAEKKLKISLNKLEILNRIMKICNEAENLSLLLEKILSSTLELMDFDGGAIYLLEENTREAELACHMRLPNDFIERIKKVNVEESPRDIVFIKGQPIFTENYPEIDPENSIKWGILSLASIPLFIKNKVIGALNIASNKRYVFSHLEKEILHSIGTDVGILISRMVAEEKLKESETKYRNLFTKFPIGIFLFDEKDNLIDANTEAYDSLSGYPIDLSIGKSFTEIITLFKNSKELLQIFKKRAMDRAKGKELKPFELKLVRENGEEIWIYWQSSVIQLGDKSIIQVTVLNITQRKNFEQKVKESEEKYREAYNLVNFYKDLFAHDMSNILQSVISTADYYSIFQNNPEKLKKMENIAEIVKIHAKRGANLILNVRKLSKLDETETRLSAIQIFDVLNKSVDNAINSFQERNLKVVIEGLSKDIKILGNELLIDIFDNVLNNAAKYNNNEDTVKINVKISKTSEEDIQHIRFDFIDYGMGVPDDKKETLFTKKYNKNVGKRGMGMGLSLVKKIVEKYEGKIWVENRVKEDYTKGSNFVILFREA